MSVWKKTNTISKTRLIDKYSTWKLPLTETSSNSNPI